MAQAEAGTRLRAGRRVEALRVGLLIAAGIALIGLVLLGALASGSARAWALARASARLGRPVQVDGRLSISPGLGGLTVRFAHLHVDQPVWAGPSAMLEVDQGRVDLPWSFLIGDARVSDLDLNGVRLALRRNAAGQANWSAANGASASRFPSIGRVVIRHASLDLQDAPRDLSFHGVADATVGRGVCVVTLVGGGLVKGRRWILRGTSSQPLSGSSRYGLSVQTAFDSLPTRSTLRLEGELRLAHGAELRGRLTGDGPDLHAFSQLTGLPLPRTPPYQLSADVDAMARQVRLEQVSGRIGASDVTGTMSITPQPGGRRLDADLGSRSLRISDLFAVASGGELTQPHRTPGQLLPDASINAAPLRQLTGTVRFSAASVQPPTTPTIRSLKLVVRLERGRVVTDPMVLELAHGRGVVRTVLDVRGPTPVLSFAADLQKADTAELFKASGAPIRASFDAKVRLVGSGRSLAAAAANASGVIDMRVLNGQLQEAPADVLSADVVRAVISLLTRSRSPVELKCAVARFQVSKGEAQASVLRLSTALGGVDGSGGFDLGSDTLDMTLRPTGALSGPTSVRIAGALAHPKATLALDTPSRVFAKAFKGLTRRGGADLGSCA